MQGQKGESFTERLEFNRLSSTDNQGRVQQAYQNSMISSNTLCSTNATITQADAPTNESASLLVQNFSGSSSSGPLCQGSKDSTKVEPISLTLSSGVDIMLEDRGHEAPSGISLENMGVNTNGHHVDNGQSRALSFRLLDRNLNSAQDAGVDGRIYEFQGADSCPQQPSTCFSQHEQLAYPGIVSDLNRDSRLSSENTSTRSGGTLAGRPTYLKRKNIEGIAGPSSASGSSRAPYNSETSLHDPIIAFHNATNGFQIVDSPDTKTPRPSVSNQHLDQASNAVTTRLSYGSYHSSSSTDTAESSQRNIRLRINPANQHSIPSHNLCLAGVPATANQHSTCQVPNTIMQSQFSQPPETRQEVPSTSAPSLLPFSVDPSLPSNGIAIPRNGAPSSSGSSSASSSAERVIVSRDETSSRTIPRNSMPDVSLFPSSVDARQLSQDPTNWNLVSAGILGSATFIPQSGNNSALNASVVRPSPAPHHTSSQQALILPEVARGRVSQSRNQMRDSSLQLGLTRHPSGGNGSGNQQLLRSGTLNDMQSNGVPTLPFRSLARERRSRMISEIRDALDLLHRGENLRLEDVLFLDGSILHGFAERYDRHRDLRLDVDNMSYEELLALEERIGNVGTGLSEETIMQSLKRQQYLSPTAQEANEVEPCCICQGEYVEGDQLGKLDCGHDFHTACIKQWLTYKNLCPTCKATALNT